MKIFLLFLIIIISGCSNQKTNTIIDVQHNIAINYPITKVNKIDKNIESYVNNIYNSYDKKNGVELNINYKYNTIDNFKSLELYTYEVTNNSTINTIYTQMSKDGKVIEFSDLVSKDEFSKILPFITKNINENYNAPISFTSNIKYENIECFSMDNDYLYIFFNYNDNVLKTKLENKITKNKDSKSKINIKSSKNTIDINKKSIALTFDDGPSKYTKKIIDLLNKYNLRATFFVIGNKIDIYEDTIKYMIESGNEIGNHSYNHKWLTRLSDEEFDYEISQTQKELDKFNYQVKLLRPTYGGINSNIRKLSNLEIVMWTMDTRDWEIKKSNIIAKKALSKIKENDIILMHDTKERTYKALEIMIPKLVKEGYQFLTVSELKEKEKLQKYER